MINKQEIIKRISESLDPDDIVDRLNLEPEDIVRKFIDKILDNLDDFEDVLMIGEYEDD